MVRALVIEDDEKVAGAMRAGLAADGHVVAVSSSGEDGYYRATTEPFDVVVLDLSLPGRDGLEILSTLRTSGLRMPVLVVTARDSVEDRVAGLDTGADDYLVKPFALTELRARVRALVRRGKPEGMRQLRLADLMLDPLDRAARRGDHLIELTAREFELLTYLMRHQGQIVSRDMLARDVWKETARATSLDNVIDVHITRVRRKIDQGFSPHLIHTVRGVGFVMKTNGP